MQLSETAFVTEQVPYREIDGAGLYTDPRFRRLSLGAQVVVHMLFSHPDVIAAVAKECHGDVIQAVHLLDEASGFSQYVRPIEKTLRLARFKGKRT